jgi:hypothetical protein
MTNAEIGMTNQIRNPRLENRAWLQCASAHFSPLREISAPVLEIPRSLRVLCGLLFNPPESPLQGSARIWGGDGRGHDQHDGQDAVRILFIPCILSKTGPDAADAAQSNRLQHSEIDFPDQLTADAAQSNKLQHLKIDFTDEPAGDAAQSNKLQHLKIDFPDQPTGDAAQSHKMQHSEIEFCSRRLRRTWNEQEISEL